jgi:hypothetical protein
VREHRRSAGLFRSRLTTGVLVAASPAQETFRRALDDAVRTHGAGDQTHRVAYLALKQKFEKRGDHWIAKDDPADCGGGGKAGQRATRGNSSGQQIQRPAS